MTDATPNPLYNLECAPNTGNHEDPDLLAGDNLDKIRDRNPYPAMSERYRLTEELENSQYQNKLLVQKCRELEAEIKEAKERPYYFSIKHEAEIRMTNFSIGLTNQFCHDLSALTGDKDELRKHLIHMISEGIANKVIEVVDGRDTRLHQFAAKADFIGLWKGDK